MELLVPATQLRGPGIVGYGSVTHYSSDSAQNSWHLRWHNVGAEASSRYTDSGSERYRHVDVVTGSACVVRLCAGNNWHRTLIIHLLHTCAFGLLSSQIFQPSTLHLSCLICVSLQALFFFSTLYANCPVIVRVKPRHNAYDCCVMWRIHNRQ